MNSLMDFCFCLFLFVRFLLFLKTKRGSRLKIGHTILSSELRFKSPICGLIKVGWPCQTKKLYFLSTEPIVVLNEKEAFLRPESVNSFITQ